MLRVLTLEYSVIKNANKLKFDFSFMILTLTMDMIYVLSVFYFLIMKVYDDVSWQLRSSFFKLWYIFPLLSYSYLLFTNIIKEIL